jgi:hypothetical protein
LTVSSVGAIQTALPKPELAEKPGAGPDHDGDADDGVAAPTQAAKPAGTGAFVDKTA